MWRAGHENIPVTPEAAVPVVTGLFLMNTV
jgi:hypothetical protein